MKTSFLQIFVFSLFMLSCSSAFSKTNKEEVAEEINKATEALAKELNDKEFWSKLVGLAAGAIQDLKSLVKAADTLAEQGKLIDQLFAAYNNNDITKFKEVVAKLNTRPSFKYLPLNWFYNISTSDFVDRPQFLALLVVNRKQLYDRKSAQLDLHNALCEASRQGNNVAVQKLLQAGARPYLPATETDTTALDYAANKEVAETLIKHGAPIYMRAPQGTALHKAAADDKKASLEVFEVLISQEGAILDIKDRHDMTPEDILTKKIQCYCETDSRGYFPKSGTQNQDTRCELYSKKLEALHKKTQPQSNQAA